MHELSITQGVVEICGRAVDGRRVLSVVLEIGALSNVVPDAIAFCFDACTEGTLLQGARLIIEPVGGRGRCLNCAAEFPVHAYYQRCPECAGYGITILSGEELRVKSLEVE